MIGDGLAPSLVTGDGHPRNEGIVKISERMAGQLIVLATVVVAVVVAVSLSACTPTVDTPPSGATATYQGRQPSTCEIWVAMTADLPASLDACDGYDGSFPACQDTADSACVMPDGAGGFLWVFDRPAFRDSGNGALPFSACETEDSTLCVWDAATAGNGRYDTRGRYILTFADERG